MGPELRNVSARPLIKSRVAAKSSGMTGVETILSEILIESMERLMHLKRKDSIKLKNIRKWMEGKIPVLHELSIHSGLLPKFDGARNDSLTKLLHPFRFIAISDGL